MTAPAVPGRTSIIVVSYNHRAYLSACVRALEGAGLDPANTRLILVDNASADGSAALIRDELLNAAGDATRGGLPAVLMANQDNRGFAGGNNQALRRAMDDGDAYAYLLNPDTEVEPDFLARVVAVARTDNKIAQVQSLLVRGPGRDIVNSFGNALHYLGFGYAAGDGLAVHAPEARDKLSSPRDIAYASGAGVLVRLSALAEIGLFNEELFAYHEDLELSWRAHLAGHRVVFAPDSRVVHKYEFSRSPAKFYLMERNRFLVLAWCYDWRTLAMIAPALGAMEMGLWLFAARGGWWRDKARATAYVLSPRRWPAIMNTRRRVQALRACTDREATALFTGEVLFPAMSPWLLTAVANPIFRRYWALVRSLMR